MLLHAPRRLLIVIVTTLGLLTLLGLRGGGVPARAAPAPPATQVAATPTAGAGTNLTPRPAAAAQPRSCVTAKPLVMETLVVPFVLGTAGVSTKGCYKGSVRVRVSGIGQAAGTQYSDAFYVFTTPSGQPKPPIHYGPPNYLYTWELWINGGPSDYYVQPIPPYHSDHVYTFTIIAPGGALNFAVGDIKTHDNTGNYIVTLCQL